MSSLEVSRVSRFFKALGDDTRMRIVALLAHGELCVCHIESMLKLTQPSASRQLAVLKVAGVVTARRAGTWVHYRLAAQDDASCQRHLRALQQGFRRDAALKREIARVVKRTGPGACQ
ncbi:MAG: metalloregulator ArsR/SmtB family transcription factor [Archangium sp.]